MKIILYLSLLIVSFGVCAKDYFDVSPTVIEIKTQNGISKFEEELKYPEELLISYKPVGADIKNKKQSHNSFEFVAVKTYLGISYHVKISGRLETKVMHTGCLSSERGYQLNVYFEGSDELISDNVSELQIMICAIEFPRNLKAKIQAKIMKGQYFSSFSGGFIKSMIEAQITPLLTALKNRLEIH
jgi:hypothetical protein